MEEPQKIESPQSETVAPMDYWKLRGLERSWSMDRRQALAIINRAREGQHIDPITITAALWVCGDIS